MAKQKARRLAVKDSAIMIKISAETKEAAANRAAALQMTLSDVVRRLVTTFASIDYATGDRIVVIDAASNGVKNIPGL